jgi:hypothetical protein
MAKLTLTQKADIGDSAVFQRRFQVALQQRAMYWLSPSNPTFNGMVARQKYNTLSDGIFNNRVATDKQRTPAQGVLMFLSQYVEPNPQLDADGLPIDAIIETPSAQSPDGGYYFDAYFRDWAGVTTADETTPV